MTDRFPDILSPAVDSSGNPISGAKLNFYITGTTTEKDTWSDSAKTILNANPVVANSAGRWGDIFMATDVAYSVVFTDAADVEIQTFDPVFPILQPGTFPIISVVNKSSDYTVLTTDRGATIYVDASSGPVTITLLAIATAESGFFIRVKKVDSSANVVTVDGNGAELIDGLTTIGLGLQYDALGMTSDASKWNIDAEKRLPTPVVGIADQAVVVNSAGTGFTTSGFALPRSYLSGLILSNGTDTTNDIDIAVGEARDTADTANLTVASAIGKQIDATWAPSGTPGTPTGGLSSSLTLTNDTWYHVILGKVSDTEEVGIDTSLTGANLVTDHSFANTRYIGSVLRETATNKLFFQDGDYVYWVDRATEFTSTTLTTGGALQTVTTPLGLKLKGIFVASANTSVASSFALFTSPDETDTVPSAAFHDWQTVPDGRTPAIHFERLTDTSSQIRERGTTVLSNLWTVGYINRRGRDD